MSNARTVQRPVALWERLRILDGEQSGGLFRPKVELPDDGGSLGALTMVVGAPLAPVTLGDAFFERLFLCGEVGAR